MEISHAHEAETWPGLETFKQNLIEAIDGYQRFRIGKVDRDGFALAQKSTDTFYDIMFVLGQTDDADTIREMEIPLTQAFRGWLGNDNTGDYRGLPFKDDSPAPYYLFVLAKKVQMAEQTDAPS